MKQVHELLGAITEEAKSQGVDPDLAIRIFGAENFAGGKIPEAGTVRADRVSPKGAAGLMQVMPATQAALEKQGRIPKGLDPKNPAHSIKMGVATIRESLERTGDPRATIAEYNGGTAARRAVQAGKEPPAEETRRYMQSTGASNTTPTQRVTVTSRGPEDVSSIMDMLNAHSTQQSALAQQLSGLLKSGAEAIATTPARIQEAGEQGAAVAEAKGRMEVAKNKRGIDIATLFRGTIDDPNGIVQSSQRAIAEAQAAQAQLEPEIEQRLQVDFLDDPLGWIAAQVEVGGLKKKYNSARRVELAALSRQTQVQQSIAAQQAVDYPNLIQDATIAANAQAAALKAQAAVEAAQAQGKSYQLLAAGLEQDLANGRNDVQMRLQVALRLADQVSVSTGEKAMSDKIKIDIAPVNARRLALGLQPYTELGWKDLSSKERTEQRTWAMKPGFGEGPGDALLKLKQFGGLQGFAQTYPEAAKQIGSFQQSAEFKKAITDRAVKDQNFAKLDDDERRAVILDEVATKWVTEVKRNPKDKIGERNGFNLTSPNNPYRLNTRMAAGIKPLQDNPFNKYVLDKLSTDLTRPVSDEELVKFAEQRALVEPAKAKQVAAELAQYFQYAVRHQYETKQLGLLGMPRIDDYVVGGLDDDQWQNYGVQMTSPASVENWLKRRIIADAKRKRQLTESSGASYGGSTLIPR